MVAKGRQWSFTTTQLGMQALGSIAGEYSCGYSAEQMDFTAWGWNVLQFAWIRKRFLGEVELL